MNPSAIAWKPCYDADDGTVWFGSWIWRYDLAATEDGDTVLTLTYDWSAISLAGRERTSFPPLSPDHLHGSVMRLAAIVAP